MIEDDYEKANIIERFRASGGKLIIDSGVDNKTNRKVEEDSTKFDIIKCTQGIHPEIFIKGSEVYDDNATESNLATIFTEYEKIITTSKHVIGIGECGFDYYWLDKLNITNSDEIKALQRIAFKQSLQLANKFNLPVIIHCRDKECSSEATQDALRLLKEVGVPKKGVFHSYTGNATNVAQILEMGFYISFNGIITYKKANNVRAILKSTPQDRILLETDSPYLVPIKSRAKGRSLMEPSLISETAEYVAMLKNLETHELWDQVYRNITSLFGDII